MHGFRFSVRKWYGQIRANQIHHVNHILNVPKSISLANDQFDLVVCSFDPYVAHSEPDGIQDVRLVSLDLAV